MGTGAFGGFPLDGYREPRAVFYLGEDNRLTVYEYDLPLPAGEAMVETFNIRAGKSVLDLSSFSGIVSFELEKPEKRGKARVELA